MSYDPRQGLLMVGGIPVPMKYMRAETYKVTRSITDIDSYRDANVKLHRNASSHIVYKIEFDTPPLMTNKEMSNLMRLFQNAFSVPEERKMQIKAYIPEIDDYITQDAYMPDLNFSIYGVFDGVIKYNQVRFAFIGY